MADVTATTDPSAAFTTARVAVGILYFDQSSRVLLVKPTYKDYLDIPGGYVDKGESPIGALRREIHEELRAPLPIGPVLVVDWAPWDEGDKILFVFDGGVLTNDQIASIHVDGVEIAEIEFHHPDRLDDILIPRLARRLKAALAVRDSTHMAYLENGSAAS